MAYEYKKLSEVDVVDSVDSSVNLLVEQGSDIKKMNIGDLPIPTGQAQADWNEEDETKPSFIKNKPDLSQVGGSGGGEVLIVDINYNGSIACAYNATQLKEKLESGTLIYIQTYYSGLMYYTNPRHLVVSYEYVPSYTASGTNHPALITLYYFNETNTISSVLIRD